MLLRFVKTDEKSDARIALPAVAFATVRAV
jgi:hypothetical protein